MDGDQDEAADANSSGGQLKRRRITRACDRCHRSGIKCSPSKDPNTCGPCRSYGTECTYARPVKRRGPPPKPRDGSDVKAGQTPPNNPDAPLNDKIHLREQVDYGSWVYHEVAPPHIIEELAEAYHTIIYPIQNYFHWPSFFQDVRQQRYMHDRPFFACVMALCALTSARLRDGACLPNHSQVDPRLNESSPLYGYVGRPSADPEYKNHSAASEDFYLAACEAIPRDPTRATDFNYKRAKTHLALLCIQYGDVRQLMVHLHDYLTASALDGFHLESRWPVGLTEIEIQERRRMFWATYQLDVYVAVTWGVTIRHRESETTVLYPAEVIDDEDIHPDGIRTNHRDHSNHVSSHMRGWNFTTDLYRILEHAVAAYRTRRRGPEPDPRGAVSALYREKPARSSAEVLAVVRELYANLPQEFRTVEPVSGDIYKDRFAFQAVNIIITMQTLKMVLAGSEESSVSQKCAIAGELLDALANVPTAYIQAISAPTLHHLAGVGHLLGSVIHSPLSQWTYLQVRNILLSLADLLQGLESALSSQSIDIAQRLRSHVSRIDAYMTDAAKARREIGINHGLGTQVPLEAQYRSSIEPRTSDARNQDSGYRPEIAPGGPVANSATATSTGQEELHRTPPRPGFPEAPVSVRASRPEQPAAGAEFDLRQLGIQSRNAADGSAQGSRLPADAGGPGTRTYPLPPSGVPFGSSPGLATLGGQAALQSSPAQIVLPQDLFFDWPFDLGQGEAFDLLGDLGGFWTNNNEATAGAFPGATELGVGPALSAPGPGASR